MWQLGQHVRSNVSLRSFGKELELRVTKQSPWQRIRAPSEVPLVTAFQPRTILCMEQIVDLQPGAVFDYMGVVLWQTGPQTGVGRC